WEDRDAHLRADDPPPGQTGAEKARAEADAQKARAQLELYRAQMQQAQAQYQAAMANLKAAEAALADAQRKAAAQAPATPAKPRKVTIIIEGEDGKEQRIEVPSGRINIEGGAGFRSIYGFRMANPPSAGVVVGQ